MARMCRALVGDACERGSRYCESDPLMTTNRQHLSTSALALGSVDESTIPGPLPRVILALWGSLATSRAVPGSPAGPDALHRPGGES